MIDAGAGRLPKKSWKCCFWPSALTSPSNFIQIGVDGDLGNAKPLGRPFNGALHQKDASAQHEGKRSEPHFARHGSAGMGSFALGDNAVDQLIGDFGDGMLDLTDAA